MGFPVGSPGVGLRSRPRLSRLAPLALAWALAAGPARASVNVILKTPGGIVVGADTRMRVDLQEAMPFDVKRDDFGKIAQVGSHAVVVFTAMAYFKPNASAPDAGPSFVEGVRALAAERGWGPDAPVPLKAIGRGLLAFFAQPRPELPYGPSQVIGFHVAGYDSAGAGPRVVYCQLPDRIEAVQPDSAVVVRFTKPTRWAKELIEQYDMDLERMTIEALASFAHFAARGTIRLASFTSFARDMPGTLRAAGGEAHVVAVTPEGVRWIAPRAP